jgi:hypothetical protein
MLPSNDFSITYEYGWQNTSHHDDTIEDKLLQVSTILSNQCSWQGSISFLPHNAGGEVKDESC